MFFFFICHGFDPNLVYNECKLISYNSRPNFSTLLHSVFIRSDLKLLYKTFYKLNNRSLFACIHIKPYCQAMSDFPSGLCLDCNQLLFHFCGCVFFFVFLLLMLFFFSHWNWLEVFGRKKNPRHFPTYRVSSLFFSFSLLTFSVWKNSFSDCDAIFLRPNF